MRREEQCTWGGEIEECGVGERGVWCGVGRVRREECGVGRVRSVGWGE